MEIILDKLTGLADAGPRHKTTTKGKKMSTTIPAQEQYVADELRRVSKQIQEVCSAPLADRKEAEKEWFEALKQPSLIRERVNWLAEGSYGYGACLRGKRAAKGQGNKVAQVAQLLAALEWQCTPDQAAKAWTMLSAEQQQAVNKAVAVELESVKWAVTEE